jgi:hypothetical protein
VSTEHVDHFTALPRRFTDAHIADELDGLHVLLGLHISARCYEVANTSRGIAAIRLSWLAELCAANVETIRRKLHDLRQRGWIDFDAPDPGQRIAWRIWLTGLARQPEDSKQAPHQLHTSSTETRPPVWSSSSTDLRGEKASILLEQSDGGLAQAPHALSAQGDRRNETRREERAKEQPLSEEGNYDHAPGKTTEADFDRDGTDRMLAALAALDDNGPRVSVAVADDGSLVWHGEPQEGEQGFIDDCQALVDAGLATWLEGPA